MENEAPEKGIDWEKIALYALIAFGIIMLLTLMNVFGENSSKLTKQEAYSDLINIKEIADLSVSEFVYNGVAQSLKENGETDYYVLYNSTVKVSVDANSINYSVDEEHKIVTFVFPKFSIRKPVINVDSIDIMPQKDNLFMDDVITLCRNDAFEEAKKSERLISSAQENLRSIIDAWYFPVLQGYSFEYQFDDIKGGETE